MPSKKKEKEGEGEGEDALDYLSICKPTILIKLYHTIGIFDRSFTNEYDQMGVIYLRLRMG